MDEISESALVLAAEAHAGAHSPPATVARCRTALNARFSELASWLRGGPLPASPPPDRLAVDTHGDQALATLAGETMSVLAALERLRQSWASSPPAGS